MARTAIHQLIVRDATPVPQGDGTAEIGAVIACPAKDGARQLDATRDRSKVTCKRCLAH